MKNNISLKTASILAIPMTLLAAGCTSVSSDSTLSFGDSSMRATQNLKNGSADGQMSDGKNRKYTLLSKEPLVYIAKQKNITVSHKSTDAPVERVIGNTESQDAEGNTRTRETISRTPGRSNSALDALASLGRSSGPASGGAISSEQTPIFKDVVTPVASTTYGASEIIIKSINGGFGILLLKKGTDQNMDACNAFFKALPSRSLKEIETAAYLNRGLFRPTYWLDSRKEEELDYRTNYQLASASPTFLAYMHTPPTHLTDASPGALNCPSKVRFYNYAVSHALLKRLGVLNKRGPFLAAWRDDGGKAMVLDMSEFDGKLDFKEAMESWMQMIVREPQLWQTGVHTASFKQRLRKFLNKGGESILQLMVPASLNAHP